MINVGLSIKIILLAGLKQLSHAVVNWHCPIGLSIKIILLAGLKPYGKRAI